MLNDKKNYLKTKVALIISFIILCIGFISYGIFIYSFNHTSRIYNSLLDSTDHFKVSIGARTGQTDSWPKILVEDNRQEDYKGTIYDVTIDNTGKCAISHWTLQINIEEDCYINNAWCGKFEIHQFDDKKQETIQLVDLRKYDINDLKLNYTIADPDLLISLHKGDYIVYYPDSVSKEYPINSVESGSGSITQIVFGMIFYSKIDSSIQFHDFTMDYYLQRNYWQSWFFFLLCTLGIIWIISFISFVSVTINMKQANLRFKQDERIIHQSIGVFVQFFEAKDNYTNGHSQRVAQYSKMVSEAMNFSEEETRQIYYIALMHDCGKCYIPDSILKKPGKLTDEEYEVIKSHTVKGAEMIENFTALEHVKDGVLYHHERYDGKGYPSGLAGDKIPLISRIICVADSFDAMNSRRCYRNMLTKEYIISELQNNSGKQFDPKLIKVFLKLIEENKIVFSNECSI